MAPEFNKVARVNVSSSIPVLGLSADLILPSTWTNTNPGDFFNFYLGFGGLECGLSHPAGETYMRWFANNGNTGAFPTGSPNPSFSPSSSHNLKVYLDASGYFHYLVDGVQQYQSAYTYSASTNARFIIAAAQIINTTEDYGAPWRVYHEAATFHNMKYMDTNRNWQLITGANAQGLVHHQPNASTPGGPYPAPQAPVDYTATFYLSSQKYSAALRRA